MTHVLSKINLIAFIPKLVSDSIILEDTAKAVKQFTAIMSEKIQLSDIEQYTNSSDAIAQ